MTLPHDTSQTPPVRAPRAAHATDLSLEQRGLIVAALAAFFGIAYGGPALTRFFRRPTPRERLTRRIEAARRDAGRARAHAGKRLWRLGGGTFRG